MAILSELRMVEQPLVTAGASLYPYSADLEERFRFTSRFGDEVLLHKLVPSKNAILLPRALCPVGADDQRDDGEIVHFPHGPTPRDYQKKLFKETAAFLKLGQSGQVVAYTGWGKTVLGYHAAYVVQRKALIICTKEDIYDQWIADAPKFLGISPNEVGEIRGDKCEVIGTKVCVAMIHSLSKDGKYPDWIVKGFGLVIFDECHRLPADQFSRVADMFPAKLRLGMSASPDRSDGKELLVQAHIGPIRAKHEGELMVPKVLRFRSNWQCPRTLKTDEETGEKRVTKLVGAPGKTTHIEKMIAKNVDRNRLIAGLCKMALEKGRRTVVFSTLHDHLHLLHEACHGLEKISPQDMGFYIGATTKAETEAREMVKVKPIIFTTYVMMGEGTSIDWLDTCILAMPRSKVVQPVGRIRREYPDKSPPVVMDVVDDDSPVFSGYANSRASWYQSIGCIIKDME